MIIGWSHAQVLGLVACGGIAVLCAALIAARFRRRARATAMWQNELTAEQAMRVRRVHDSVAGLDGFSLDDRLRAFAGLPDPERELVTWERMAAALDQFTGARAVSSEARQEAFRVVLLRSQMPESTVLSRVRLDALTRADAIEIMREM